MSKTRRFGRMLVRPQTPADNPAPRFLSKGYAHELWFFVVSLVNKPGTPSEQRAFQLKVGGFRLLIRCKQQCET